MGYYEDQLVKYKKQLEDKLASRPTDIMAQEGGARDILSGSDVTTQGGLTDMMTGLSPLAAKGAQAQFNVQKPIQARKRESQLGFNRMKSMGDFFNKQYLYARQKYLDAGYDLKQSEQFARTWAQQQTGQNFASEMNQMNRDYLTKKDAISNEYGDLISTLKPDYGDPVQEAMIRSITGLIPYGGYLASKNFGGGKNAPMASSIRQKTGYSTGIDPNTGRRLTETEGMFDPATQSYGYLNR